MCVYVCELVLRDIAHSNRKLSGNKQQVMSYSDRQVPIGAISEFKSEKKWKRNGGEGRGGKGGET